jgi:hypothetical protein
MLSEIVSIPHSCSPTSYNLYWSSNILNINRNDCFSELEYQSSRLNCESYSKYNMQLWTYTRVHNLSTNTKTTKTYLRNRYNHGNNNLPEIQPHLCNGK